MANLRDIRNRISSIKNTQKITRAMKMVAAAKLRKAQNRMNQNRPFSGKVEKVVARLVDSASKDKPILRNPETFQSILFIIIGSDRGLCGGFNNNLFKEAESKIIDKYSQFVESDSLDIITVGRKANGYFSKRGYNVVEAHDNFFDEINYHTTSQIMNDVVELFTDQKYDKVILCYNEFKTVISQNRIIKSVLPIDPDNITDQEMDQDQEYEGQPIEYIYEPDVDKILNELLPLYLNMQLWTAVLESNAAEQGARMTAMDSATENAKELEEDLQLEYNQARQSAITTEISEIVSGAQALEES